MLKAEFIRKVEEVVGYGLMKRTGGEVVIVDFLPGRSTTSTLKRVVQVSQAGI